MTVNLKTKRLIIREPRETDFDNWHRLISDPKTMYYLDDIMTRSEAESRDNLNFALSETNNPDRTCYYLVIADAATGTFIGTIGYTVEQVLPLGKIVHVGYFILPEHHGKGYTTEAFKEIIRFAFEDNGVYRLNTGCYSENKASERVMQKCGLIKESDLKEWAWHGGKMKDRVTYRLLKPEYETGRLAAMKGIVTVIGKDRVGIIAKICVYFSDNGVNVLDISQTIVQGYFNMMMIVDTSGSAKRFEELVEELDTLGGEIGVKIKFQHEDIFNTMHRI